MRSAGCIYNDLVDRDIDAQVDRTRQRPLACGAITPRNATIVMIILMLLAAIILWQFSWPTIGLGIFSIGLVATYPWLKRITYWPQLFLGVTFNWGVLMAGGLTLPAIKLYIFGILWTIFYDTIYAHQDKTDDAIIGVKSTALRLGRKTKPFLCLLIIIQGLICPYIVPFAAWILYKVDLNDARSCMQGFKRSQLIGWVVFLVCWLNYRGIL